MNMNDSIRKQIKTTSFRLTEITKQLSYYYNEIRLFSCKKNAICFSALFVSILSWIFPVIKEESFALLFFLLTTGGIQLLAFNESKKILRRYYASYEEGINCMTKLSTLIDWSSLRKYYIKRDDEYPILTISTFMQESNRLLSPVRRGFKYYRLIQFAIIAVWSFIIICFAHTAYRWIISVL